MTGPYANIGKAVGRSMFSGLFVVAGVGHFLNPEMFVKIVPPYLPAPKLLILLSGVFEIALGVLLLVPRVSRLAAWGIVALLVAVFPANVYMFQHAESFEIPRWVLFVRLPLQGLLIYWAYRYTKRPASLKEAVGRDSV